MEIDCRGVLSKLNGFKFEGEGEGVRWGSGEDEPIFPNGFGVSSNSPVVLDSRNE